VDRLGGKNEKILDVLGRNGNRSFSCITISMVNQINLCIKCGRPVWKGDKFDRNYWQLYCKEHESAKKFLGSCDRIRQTEAGESLWQWMMKHKQEISEEEFLENVNIKDVLDKDENWKDYKENAELEGEPLRFYKSGNVYFFQHAGFEFIWSK